jgi:tRNA (adenine57-N1/adenine58-N1)-methyltransferase
MIAHTGFLVTARRLADGVTAPARRRRPAKGAHPETEAAAPEDTSALAAANNAEDQPALAEADSAED